MTSSEFSNADKLHLQAAQGWLELGDWESANEELEEIQPQLRAHPEVLKVRIQVYVEAEQWDHVVEITQTLASELPRDSFGHVHLAEALHKLGQTEEAWRTLVRVAHRFPKEWIVPYNLARYAAKLGSLVEARELLADAFAVGDAKALKLQALDEPDLEPLWRETDLGAEPNSDL